MRLHIIVLFLVMVACGDPGAGSQHDPDAVQDDQLLVFDDTQSRIVEVTGGDTVWMAVDDSGTFLRWRSGARNGSWRSSSLLGASPTVHLVDVNNDSVLDLFYTILWEELIFGELVVGEGRTGRTVYFTSRDICDIPRLEDVNSDGRLDIVEPRPMALERDECTGEPYSDVCHSALPTDWPVPLLQTPDGHFVEDSSGAGAFYEAWTQRFERGAARLRNDLLTQSGVVAQSPRCDQQMLEVIEAMALRARGLSR